MIKLFGIIYINPLTILLFVLFYFSGNITLLFISYGIMIIHELCHLTAALLIGLRPAYIAIQPFGVCLKLKNKIVRALSDEIILYLSGPLSNIVMALISKLFFAHSVYTDFFYLSNVMLFVTNMLPIIPLDGGMTVKKILTCKIGQKKSEAALKVISVILCILLCTAGAYMIYINKTNYSVMVLAVNSIANIFTQKEKYNTDYIKELMFYKNKNKSCRKRPRIVIHEKNSDLRKTIAEFGPNDYSIVCVIDENNNITDWLTEHRILNTFLK